MTYELRSSTITFEAALRDLESRRDRVRAEAAHALGDVRDPEARARAVPALIEVLGDPRPEVRTEAALSLGDLNSEQAVEPLVQRLEDPVSAVRQAAAMALGRLGAGAGFEPLARALADGPVDLRFQAATSLAEIDPERAREPLRAALGDEDGEVVGAVAVALGAIGETAAIERLVALLDDWSRPQTRFDIGYALADLGDPRAVDVLGPLLEEERWAWDGIEILERLCDQVAAGAGEAGADHVGADHVGAGDDALLGQDHADADAVGSAVAAWVAPLLGRRSLAPTIKLRAAACVLARDPASPAVDRARAVLLAGLRNRKREQRGLAIEQLARVGGDWAVGPLEQLRARRAGKPFREELDAALGALRDS